MIEKITQKKRGPFFKKLQIYVSIDIKDYYRNGKFKKLRKVQRIFIVVVVWFPKKSVASFVFWTKAGINILQQSHLRLRSMKLFINISWFRFINGENNQQKKFFFFGF